MTRAIIFDFDGVITDSEPLHYEMFRRTLEIEGVPLTRETYDAKYLAMDDKGCFSAAFADHGRALPPEHLATLIERKAALLEAEMRRDARLFPGVATFILDLARHAPLAINSGALRPEIELVLESSGLRAAFSVIVSAEDVSRCKPDPEGYRLALEKLNAAHADGAPIRPEECLVIEDSVAGVESALRAGMKCLAITNSYPAASLARANRVVTTCEGLTWRSVVSI
jgi:HAD superfamily hydrolase (TIGR01509 family)